MKTERVYSKNATYQRFEVLKTTATSAMPTAEFWLRACATSTRRAKRLGIFLAAVFPGKAAFPLGGGDAAERPHAGELRAAAFPMRELSGKEDTSELLAIGKSARTASRSCSLSPTPLLAPVRPAQQPRQPGHDFALVRRFGRGRPNSHGARRGFVRSGGHRGLHGIVLLRTHHPRAGKPKRV